MDEGRLDIKEIIFFSLFKVYLCRDEEINEKKRDWKEEKNTSDEKEKVEEEDKSEVVVEEEKKSEKDENKREGRYHGVPAGYLHCFVCNKSMWDGESFQNHLRGIFSIISKHNVYFHY